MHDPRIDGIFRRLKSLEVTHTQWRPVWQELSDYIIPRKNDIYMSQSVGKRRTEQLFDSTAVHANEILASSMAGSLTNQSMKWFTLKMRDERLNDVYNVNLWLQDCVDRMNAALQASNFAAEILEVYLDLGALGTACVLIEEKPAIVPGFAGLQFKACNIGEYVIDENSEGIVDTVFRRIPMSARNIVSKWPTTVNDAMIKEAETTPDTIRMIVHAVVPRPGVTRISAKGMPFASFYMEERERSLLSEGGFFELPYAVPRWTKASREKYGRGPGHTALPDIKVLNKVKDLSLKTWAKVLDPPTMIQHEGIIGNLRLTPGGINYTRGLPKEVMEQFRVDARFDLSQLKEEELRNSIRNMYWSNQLELQQGPQMTAHEVMIRYELMQRLLGPTLGRLESELLAPTIRRIFNMMARTGALAPLPPELEEYAAEGGDIDIQYESPIARAQRSGDATAIQATFEFAAPFMEFKPELMDIFDMDEVVRTVAEVRGMPNKTMRDEIKVKKMRQARAEQEAKMAETQQALQQAEAAKNVAPMAKVLTEAETEE